MDMWICLDETSRVFSWQGQYVVKPLWTSLKGRQHFVEVESSENRKLEEVEGEELNGVEEGAGGMSEKKTELTVLKNQQRPTGVGPRHKPTQKEREEHDRNNTRTVQRKVQTVHDGQRAHPSPRHQMKERRTHHCDGKLLDEK